MKAALKLILRITAVIILLAIGPVEHLSANAVGQNPKTLPIIAKRHLIENRRV